jgi:hypothetical protein
MQSHPGTQRDHNIQTCAINHSARVLLVRAVAKSASISLAAALELGAANLVVSRAGADTFDGNWSGSRDRLISALLVIRTPA